MRTALLIIAIAFVLLSFKSSDEAGIEGTILDHSTGEPLIIATVFVTQKDKLVTTISTDHNGRFRCVLPLGSYEVEAAYVGYHSKKIDDVHVKLDAFTKIEISMEQGTMLDEIVIVDYKVPLVTFDHTSSASTVTSETKRSRRKKRRSVKKAAKTARLITESKAMPTKSISEIAATSAGISTLSSGDVSIRGSRPDATFYYIDGVRVAAAPDMLTEIVGDEIAEEEMIIDLPDAGQLTAAEWNDLKNWEDWNELIQSGVYKDMVDYWGLSGLKRHSLFVTNDEDVPLSNQKVKVLSDLGEILWEATTDNNGSAELWIHEAAENYRLVTGEGKKKVSVPEVSVKGYDRLELDLTCEQSSSLDLMFVVDATGSMMDEINFLRAELGNVIDRVKTETAEAEVEIRVGTVFYKDTRDDYLTAHMPLDKNLKPSLDFIKSKDAGGGGDTPEAVDSALEVALAQDWDASAINRLLFLILDAPPHHNEAVLKRLQHQVKEAAARGIKIIPISASGIDRYTEYLMKQMAILTNGTYVFLTDDSGIGNPHLAPVVPDYEVEMLNDLLVRIISNYAKVHDCDQPIDVQNQQTDVEVKAYPNPTSGQITITTDQSMDALILSSASGQQLLYVEQPELEHRMDISQFIPGMYSLTLVSGGRKISSHSIIKI